MTPEEQPDCLRRLRAMSSEEGFDEARRERDALRAIVEGRTIAPTDAEIEAHWRAGGTWLHQSRLLLTEPSTAARCALYQRESGGYLRWMPLDKDGRPCAWPVVTP